MPPPGLAHKKREISRDCAVYQLYIAYYVFGANIRHTHGEECHTYSIFLHDKLKIATDTIATIQVSTLFIISKTISCCTKDSRKMTKEIEI